MISYRCLPLTRGAGLRGEGGALWFPRPYQGDGRHDNPDLYGCLYVSEREVSPIVERLERFRGRGRVQPGWLVSGARPLALVAIVVPDDLVLVDLDEPRTLSRERLRPSTVATRARALTQEYARSLYARHPEADGLRWWSTRESSWINLTLFDRLEPRLGLAEARQLTVFDPIVQEAADFLGLA